MTKHFLNLKDKINALREKRQLTVETVGTLLEKEKIMSTSNFRQIISSNRGRSEGSLTIKNLKQIAEVLDYALIVEFIEPKNLELLVAPDPIQSLLNQVAEQQQEINFLRKKLISYEAHEYFKRGAWFHDMYVSPYSTETQKEIAYGQIAKYYLKALSANPNHCLALSNYGSLELREARKKILINQIDEFWEFYKRGLYYYRIAKLAEPNNPNILNNEINIVLTEYYFYKINEPKKALLSLKKAKKELEHHLKQQPEIALEFYYALACLEANLGNIQKALNLLKILYQNEKYSAHYRFRKKEALITDSDLSPLFENEDFLNWLKEN